MLILGDLEPATAVWSQMYKRATSIVSVSSATSTTRARKISTSPRTYESNTHIKHQNGTPVDWRMLIMNLMLHFNICGYANLQY